MNDLCMLLVVILSLQNPYFVVSARPPNMVIIILDDVGYGDLGCYWNPTGQRSNTPFLDYMASEGIRFTDFHSAGSVCVPSRGSILTGRMCVRTGFPNRIPDDVIGGLPFNETIIAETFKAAGYRTGLIGKWGSLGVSPKYHPNSRGFDLFYGLPDSNNHGCTLEAGGTVKPRVCPSSWSDIPEYNGTRCSLCSFDNDIGNYGVPLYHNRIIIEQPVNQTTLSLRYSQMAAEFVKDGSQPYLLYVALAHMHTPLFHMPEFEGKSASNSVYGDTLLEMDNTIKTIVEAIRESGEEANTLIWVASDNGPDEGQCQFAGSPGPFTGVWQRKEGGGGSTSKSTPFEGGHRVPSIVYWPGTIEGGQVSDALISGMDVYPTMAALANIQMPGDRTYDGMDISDLLLGRPFHGRRVISDILHNTCCAHNYG
ncbi:Arylsulfatase G [Holothuria leucospilota]|uniref:Arylsulfatase G n=1 Tax=Holothuria leucospilota TaxID=206669 RepID=A0A9Q1HA43_HOLLE|nr:Arylsulfatase G [Holothuria leucospilota]